MDKITPYSVTKSQPYFDWDKTLDDLISGKTVVHFHDHTSLQLHLMAKSWITCACGNQCAAIPRDHNGAPVDTALTVLGCRFYDHIRDQEWRRAKATLESIEARSIELLSKMNPDKPLA